MRKTTRKYKPGMRHNIEVIAKECIRRKTMKPVLWFFKKFTYGEKNQFKGTVREYIPYCDRKHIQYDFSQI